MKLSEAIRLGAMLKPQAHCLVSPRGTCALGAALDAIGSLPTVDAAPGELGKAMTALCAHWPIANARAPHPMEWTMWPVWTIVQSLNDFHAWTREQIADWVETLESQAVAKDGAGAGSDSQPVGERAEITS